MLPPLNSKTRAPSMQTVPKKEDLVACAVERAPPVGTEGCVSRCGSSRLGLCLHAGARGAGWCVLGRLPAYSKDTSPWVVAHRRAGEYLSLATGPFSPGQVASIPAPMRRLLLL